jgi:hypothetical protein
MDRQNNSKKKKQIAKIIGALTSLGILIALILNTTQLFDRFCNNDVTPPQDDTSTAFIETKHIPSKKPPKENEVVKESLDVKIEVLIEEARKVKSKSQKNCRDKYLEAYELLSESQKNKQFINSINNSTSSIDFVTQNNLLDSFFVSLKY